MKDTYKVNDDYDGRISPPYGVIQPPELPKRSDFDPNENRISPLNTMKRAKIVPEKSSGLFCCTATKAIRRSQRYM